MPSMQQKCNISATFWFSEKFYNSFFSWDVQEKKPSICYVIKILWKITEQPTIRGSVFLTHPVVIQKDCRGERHSAHFGGENRPQIGENWSELDIPNNGTNWRSLRCVLTKLLWSSAIAFFRELVKKLGWLATHQFWSYGPDSFCIALGIGLCTLYNGEIYSFQFFLYSGPP